MNVHEITINEQHNYCYEHLPVSMKIMNREINGFLTEDLIITKFSKEVECTENKQLYVFLDNKVIVYQGKKAFFSHDIMTKNNPNFRHAKVISQGIDSVINYLNMKNNISYE